MVPADQQVTRYVPLALPEPEARALFNAARAVFAQLTAAGMQWEDATGDLARAMMALAERLDEVADRAH